MKHKIAGTRVGVEQEAAGGEVAGGNKEAASREVGEAHSHAGCTRDSPPPSPFSTLRSLSPPPAQQPTPNILCVVSALPLELAILKARLLQTCSHFIFLSFLYYLYRSSLPLSRYSAISSRSPSLHFLLR
ncbi:hypothetical protein R5R35_009573 [Gryllus longicercus]|uniref:Uncharacterized protein n=1 Tax=Gryllus longicercus TaxID=2509291 RepID=A0AAN9V101_9ORTH